MVNAPYSMRIRVFSFLPVPTESLSVMLTFDAWFTLVVIAVMFVALAREFLTAEAVMMLALSLLWTKGVVTTEEAFKGFSNGDVLTIGMLYVVSAAMRETGGLHAVSHFVLGKQLDRKRVLARLLIPVASLSAFFNNTPIVMMLTPAVRDWALRNERAPSKFLIPLSYATMLGGACTLIGTSSNLIVSGMLESMGYRPLSMFEVSPVGVSVAVSGIIFLLLFSKKLLPDRRSLGEQIQENAREYSVTLEVQEDCPLIGKSIEDAGLRSLRGLFLADLERNGAMIAPVHPGFILAEGDRLNFFGAADTVVDLQRIRGLAPVSESGAADAPMRASSRLFEVVVSANSPLEGSTLKEINFRRRYDAAVIALHRGGERVRSKLGEVRLKAGDTLMVEAAKGFRAAWGGQSDFYLVSRIEDFTRPRYEYAPIALLIVVLMVLAMATGAMTPFMASTLAAASMIVSGCISPDKARRSLDLSVIVLIAAAFGVARAVVNVGLSDAIAEYLIGSVAFLGPFAVLAVLYLVAIGTTEVLGHAAAAALLVPIAVSTADFIDRDPRSYVIAICIAVGASFITPYSYQTNMMVYGPGGYRFGDYVRIGIPMSLLTFVVAMIVVPLVYGL